MGGPRLEAWRRVGGGAAALGGSGARAQWAAERVALVCGNEVVAQEPESGRQKAVGAGAASGAKRGLSALASGGGLLAVSAREPSTAVHVLDAASGALVCKLSEGGPELEVAQLALSRDGSRCAAVGAHFARELVVWSLSGGRCLGRAALEEDCLCLSFSPLDDSVLCSSGRRSVSFWQVRETGTGWAIVLLSRYAPAASVNVTTSAATAAAAATPAVEGFLGHAWTRENHVVAVARDGSLVKLDPHSSIVLKSLSSGAYEHRSVAVILDALLVGCADGQVRWLRDSSWGEAAALRVAPANVAVTELALDASCRSCVCSCADGSTAVFETDPSLAASGDGAARSLRALSAGHVGPALGVAPVFSVAERTALVATVGADGSLRVWDAHEASSQPLAVLLVDDALAAAEAAAPPESSGESGAAPAAVAVPLAVASSPRSPFLAVGTSGGHLLTVLVAASGGASRRHTEAAPAHSLRAQSGPLSMLAFDREGRWVATASPADSAVSLFSVPPSGEVPALVAVAELGRAKPAGLAWDARDNSLLVAAAEPGGPVRLLRFSSADVPQTAAAYGAAPAIARLSGSSSGTIDGATAGVLVDLVALPLSGRVATGASRAPGLLDLFEGPVLKRVKALECAAHQAGVWRVSPGPDKSPLFCAGSLDGAVSVWRDSAPEPPVLLAADESAAAMVAALCLTSDAKLLVAAHVDGALSVLHLAGLELPAPAMGEWQAAGADLRTVSKTVTSARQRAAATRAKEAKEAATKGVHESGSPEEAAAGAVAAAPPQQPQLSEAAKWALRSQEALDVEFERTRNERRGRVGELQQRLLQLLENNHTVPELERLERHEFTVDVGGKAASEAATLGTAEELRSNIVRDSSGRALALARIKAVCADSIEVPSRTVRAMERELAVRNFPLPKQSGVERRRLERVAQLRTVELRELRRAAGSDSLKLWPQLRLAKAVPAGVDWIVNAGQLVPRLGAEEARAKKAAEMAAASGGDGAAGGGEAGAASGEAGAAGGAPGASAAAAQEDGELPLEDMLYHPAGLRSRLQLRSQLVLLRQVQRELMAAFNKRFAALVELKEDACDKIGARYERINEILTELHQPAESAPAFWAPHEKPNAAFELRPGEVGQERYVSRVERERLAREAEEKRKRDEAAAKDNIGARALQDMMNGTLERPKEPTLAQKSLERPAWMDEVPYESMDEAQRKALEEWDVAAAKFAEEKDKYTKALELELKKARGEVSEIAQTFDGALAELAKLKVDTCEAVAVQGLYIARLTLQVVGLEDADMRSHALQIDAAAAAQELQAVAATLQAFCGGFDAQKALLQERTDADKALERGFKQALQEHVSATAPQEALDPELFKALLQVYKLRGWKRRIWSGDKGESPRHDGAGAVGSARRGSVVSGGALGSARRDSLGGSSRRDSLGEFGSPGSGRRGSSSALQHGSSLRSGINLSPSSSSGGAELATAAKDVTLDPFTELNPAKAAAAEREAALAPLVRERDLPQEVQAAVSESMWELLQRLRTAKIVSELALREQIEAVAKLQSVFDELEGERKAAQDKIDAAHQEAAALAAAKKLATSNAEVVVRMRQGQDEVAPGAVITDYSKSLILHRRAVEAENKEIAQLGAQKVGIMNKIKDFRKSINYMQWEDRWRKQQEHDLGEHYTDLHMLRVTKSLQEVIKDGEGVPDRSEQTQQQEAKLHKMEKLQAQKLGQLGTAEAKVADQVARLEQENEQLEQRIRELRANVQLRDAVLQARTGTSLLPAENAEATTAAKAAKRSGKTTTATKTAPAAAAHKARAPAGDVKMKRIVTNRRLVDLARAQADEIAFLQHELETLRDKNFPRFANPSAQLAEKSFQREPDSRHRTK